MNSNQPKQVIVINLRHWQRWAVSASIFLLLIFGYFGYTKVYTSPRRVFWRAINNSLVQGSVTKHVSASDPSSGQKISQYSQVNFASEPSLHSFVTVEQQPASGNTNQAGSGIKATIKTESIITRSAQYSRYISIDTNQKTADGKPLKLDEVIGKWGKSDAASASPNEQINQVAVGLAPFARVPLAKQKDLANQMLRADVFDPDFASVQPKVVDGHATWVYKTKLNLANYLSIYKQALSMSGLVGLEKLNPDVYKSLPPIEVIMSIDKGSGKILQLQAESMGRREDYSAHGANLPITEPTNTIPLDQLQSKLQATR